MAFDPGKYTSFGVVLPRDLALGPSSVILLAQSTMDPMSVTSIKVGCQSSKPSEMFKAFGMLLSRLREGLRIVEPAASIPVPPGTSNYRLHV